MRLSYTQVRKILRAHEDGVAAATSIDALSSIWYYLHYVAYIFNTYRIFIYKQLYSDFKDFCAEVRIPASTLMASFAAQTVRDRRVPFTIGETSRSSRATATMQKALATLHANAMERTGETSEAQIIEDVDDAVEAVRAAKR